MVKSFPVKPDLNNTAIHYISVLSIQGFPVAQMVENLPAMQEAQVQSLGREDPLEKEWQPTPVFLPGESHGQRSLVGYSPRGHSERVRTQTQTHTISRVAFSLASTTRHMES